MSCTCHYETGGEYDEQVWATCEECEREAERIERLDEIERGLPVCSCGSVAYSGLCDACLVRFLEQLGRVA